MVEKLDKHTGQKLGKIAKAADDAGAFDDAEKVMSASGGSKPSHKENIEAKQKNTPKNNSGQSEKSSKAKKQNENESKSKTKLMFIIIGISVILLFSPAILFILLLTTIMPFDEFYNNQYEYYTEGACQQVKYQDKLMSIEDYVAGAMATQFGEFSYSESTLKTTAVAIRTYTISHGTKIGDSLDDCYYDVSNNGLEHNPESDYSNYKSAVNSTKSLIITINGKITGGYYDASCVYSASQAKTLDTTGNYTNDNYYIRYGALEIDGINFQPIPIIDVDNLVGSLKEYAEKSIANGACAENNGSGISING